MWITLNTHIYRTYIISYVVLDGALKSDKLSEFVAMLKRKTE